MELNRKKTSALGVKISEIFAFYANFCENYKNEICKKKHRHKGILFSLKTLKTKKENAKLAKLEQ